MIVVVGSPVFAGEDRLPGRRAGGLSARIALAVAAAGPRVELVGKIGDDAAGDAIAVDLERAGVGHAALLRDPSAGTPALPGPGLGLDRADVELALRYLPDARVIVSVDRLAEPVVEAVAAAAAYGGAHRIVVAVGADGARDREAAEASGGTRADVTALSASRRAEGAFAGFVGRYATYLDEGRIASDAFAAATSDLGWEPTHHG